MECVNKIGCVVLGFILLLPTVLQAVGTFGFEWIKESCISINPKPPCCNVTVPNDKCGRPFNLEALDSTSFTIEMTSFVILCLPAVCFLQAFFEKEDKNSAVFFTALGGLAYLLYPIAGLLSLVGCGVVFGKFHGHTIGRSFYYCVGCGLFVLILTAIAILMFFYNKKHKRNGDGSSTVQTYGTTDAGQTTVTEETITIEQRGFMHDQKTGELVQFLTSINITHIVIHYKTGVKRS